MLQICFDAVSVFPVYVLLYVRSMMAFATAFSQISRNYETVRMYDYGSLPPPATILMRSLGKLEGASLVHRVLSHGKGAFETRVHIMLEIILFQLVFTRKIG